MKTTNTDKKGEMHTERTDVLRFGYREQESRFTYPRLNLVPKIQGGKSHHTTSSASVTNIHIPD